MGTFGRLPVGHSLVKLCGLIRRTLRNSKPMAEYSHIAIQARDAEPADESMPARLRRRALWATPITLLVAYLVSWAILLWPDPDKQIVQTDFVSTIIGAKIVSAGDGRHLYDLPTQLAVQKAIRTPYMGDEGNQLLPYVHPPFEALFIAPFVGLPYWTQYLVWIALIALAFYRSLRLMWRALPLPSLGSAGFTLALACISFGPVFRSFRLGQSSPLLLLGMCGVYAAARRCDDRLAGLYLLLVALKPQILPLVLLALLVTGRWRALAWFGGALSFLYIVTVPLLGVQWPLQYADVLLRAANRSGVTGIYPEMMHNWRGFAIDVVGWTAPWLVTPLYGLLAVATLGLLGMVWWRTRSATRTMPETAATSPDWDGQSAQLRPAFDMRWALVGLAVVLISPHLNPHDLTLLIFPAWIIAAYAMNGRTLAIPAGRWLVLLGAYYLLLSIGLSVLGNVPTVPLSVGFMALALIWLAREALRAPDTPTFDMGRSTVPR
jgi:hypothetical protein